MQKIRIKKTPKPGDQLDYGVVGRNAMFTGEGAATSNVKNTMGATTEENANIEVEGGETVVGDVNRDGFLEHFTFVGKRHSKGGMPVNIPEGSFIFSDTKKLKIKDKELLESVFGLKEKKGGYTPAEIAKKYQINQFVQDLKSEDTDAIQKRSAAEMLKKNTEKLGMLALVQESLKGFPDGIPAIAESVMAGLQGAQVPGMEQGESVQEEVMEGQGEEMAMYGGQKKKYPDGGPVKYTPNTVIYLNGVPFRYVKHEDNWGWGTGDKITFKGEGKDGAGRTYVVNSEKLGEILDKSSQGKYAETGIAGDKYKRYYVGTTPANSPDYYSRNTTSKLAEQTFKPNDTFYANGQQYKVVDANAAYKGTSYSSGNISPTTMTSVSSGKTEYDVPSIKVQKLNSNGEPVGGAFVLDPSVISNSIRRNTFDFTGQSNTSRQPSTTTNTGVDAYGNVKANPLQGTKHTIPGRDDFEYVKVGNEWKYYQKSTGITGNVTNQQSLDNLNRRFGSGQTQTQTTSQNRQQPTNTQQRPAAQPRPTGKPKTAQEALNYFAQGGSVLRQFQEAGEQTGGPGGPQQTQPGTLNTTVGNQQQAQAAGNQRIDPNKEIFVGNITLEDGTVVKAYYKGNQKYVKDANGTILATGTRTDTNFEQYGSANINKILGTSQNVLYTETNFGSFDRQPGFKQTGIYLSSGNAGARQEGDLTPAEWADFQKRHGDWIDAQYQGGFAQFQTDLRSGKATGDKAAGWFQDAVNEKSMKQAGVPYFKPKKPGQREDDPYYRDSKFGQVTYSVPRFFDAPPPPEKPGDEMSYFCVEYTDGTKNVVSVSHKVGEAPVAPSGGNIKTVSAASKDKAVADGQCISTPKKEFVKQPKKEGPWWLQDIVNYVGTMTDEVNRYAPSQGKVDLVTPGYDLLDPTRKLAANQEQMARFQSQVENTADGNVGLATTLGATGEGFANAANVLDATEAANIGIVNQAYGVNAQMQNQEIMANENARQKYVEDMATLNQQYDNSLQQRKWRQIAAFNNGTTNWFRKKQMENVLFPQVYIDPILGDVDFSGQGRQILEEDGTGLAPDVYQNPAFGGGRGSVNAGYNPAAMTQTANAAWKQAYDEAVGTRGEESARKYADQVANTYLQTARQSPTWQQGFQQAYMSGMTMPGAFNATPWDDQ
jgi:hypothetical protein